MPKNQSRACLVATFDRLPADQISTRWKFDELGDRVRQEMDLIETAQSMIPVRYIFAGCVLAQVRAALPHGEWLPWLAKHFPKKKSMAYYALDLAKVCVEEARIQIPELLALPQLAIDLAPGRSGDTCAKALAKIRRFVKGRTLSELLDEYGIKTRQPLLGGARAKPGKPVIDAETLHRMKCEEASECIERSRRLFLEENILQYLRAEEIRGVVESLEALVTDLRHAVKPLLKGAHA